MADERNPFLDLMHPDAVDNPFMPMIHGPSFGPRGRAAEEPEPEGNIPKDMWASFAGGANNLLKTAGDLYGVATDDYDNWASNAGKAGADYWQERKSPKLRQMEDARQARMDATESEWGKAGVMLWDTISNPGLMASFMFENLSTMLPAGAVGRGAGLAARAMGAGKVAEAGARTAGALGSNAAMQGADAGSQANEQLLAMPTAIWLENPEVKQRIARGENLEDVKRDVAGKLSRDAAIASGIASLGVSMIPGAKTLEKALAGVKLPKGRLASIAQGFGGESLSESLEEGSAAYFANLAAKKIDPNVNQWEGVGASAGMGAAAGVFGGLAGAVAPIEKIEDIEKIQKAITDPGATLDDSIKMAMTAAQAKRDDPGAPVDYVNDPTAGGTFRGTVADSTGRIDPFGYTPPPAAGPAPPFDMAPVEDIDAKRQADTEQAEDRLRVALTMRDEAAATVASSPKLLGPDGADSPASKPLKQLSPNEAAPPGYMEAYALQAAEREVAAAQNALNQLRMNTEVVSAVPPEVETVPFRSIAQDETEIAFAARAARQQAQKDADYDAAIQARAEQEASWAKSDSEFNERLDKYNDDNSPINPAMRNALTAAFLNKKENAGRTVEDIEQPEPPVEPSRDEAEKQAKFLSEYVDKDIQTTYPLVRKIKLSKDVPNFKEDADDDGVVEKLEGKYMRTGASPILVWERLNGTLEVISGRHRLDLARRSGEKTIPSHVVKEADGFTKTQALMADAELNIRDQQGSVSDYAKYFRDGQISEEEAQRRGLLSRFKGRAGFSLANRATETLFHNFRNGNITDAQATAIADTAPSDERLQNLGLTLIKKPKATIEGTIGTMQAVLAIGNANPTLSEQGDIFGFDDSAMREAERIGKLATERKADIKNKIKAAKNAANDPEGAKELGVNVKNPKAVKAKLAELEEQAKAWENWPTNPELRAELLKDLALPVNPAPAAAPATNVTAIDEAVTARKERQQKPVADMTPDAIKAEIEALGNEAVRRRNESKKDQTFDENIPESEFLTPAETERMQKLKMALPRSGQEAAEAAARVKEKRKAATENTVKPLSEIKVAWPVKVGDEIQTLSVPADVLLEVIDEKRTAVQNLLNCLKAK